ncbi:MAG: NifB/NifX family molybdenum-iron cluster-binding protein [Phycisphaerae bacterium]|nr:NifB/NifX family molybdenum-iron cluster-binding protein [Phycisphaerae bacterium]
MKIAITTQGQDLSSALDPRFGRAKWLLLVDSDTGAFEVHDNTMNLNASSGAGIQAAQNVANLGAEAVITGNMGPNAVKTLNMAKVQIFLSTDGTAQDALDLFKAGKLQGITEPNVEGHWA